MEITLTPFRPAGAQRLTERHGALYAVAEAPISTPARIPHRSPWTRPAGLRGTVLGQRLLEPVLDFAGQARYARMRLCTHENHRAAGKLYACNGFSLIDSQPGRAFGQEVVSQTWERAL